MTPRNAAETNSPSARRRLDSWKEIAAHLGVTVRTAQRWEGAEDLPVRRHRHRKLSSAYAYADELDRWWDSRPAAGGRKFGGRGAAPPHGESGPPAPSIVVLPFVNLDRDEETEILSDGLTEDLITALSQTQPLRVVARSSAFYFKGKARDVREIAKRLGVEAVLEGSVRRAGKSVRVTAQLVSAADGCHLWAQRFDREIGDPFALQATLAQAVAEALSKRLLGRSAALRATLDIDTHSALLRGRYFWNQRTPEALRRAIRCYEEAIDRDPDCAPAYAGIAECHVFRWAHAKEPWRDAIPRAQAALSRALEIDPGLPGLRTAVGAVCVATFDLTGAEVAFRRELEENPGDHRARHWRAMTLACLGRPQEALPEIERAFELDPLGVTVNQDFGRILYLNRRYDEAIVRLTYTLEIAPTAYWARVYLTLAYAAAGAYDEAMKAAAAEPALAAFIRGRMGDSGAVRRALKAHGKTAHSFTWRALLHCALQQESRCLEALKRAAEEHEPELLDFCPRALPLFEGLRSNPDFNAVAPH